MKIKFYTPLSGIDDQAFGAATFGFVGSEDERAFKQYYISGGNEFVHALRDKVGAPLVGSSLFD